MGLDVYLSEGETQETCHCQDCGNVHTKYVPIYSWSYNITRNLSTMAEAAGIYKHLWRPEELDIEKASGLIEPLKNGLAKLKAEPEKYKAFNPPNGWGNYENLVTFVNAYLAECIAHPNADISVSR